MCEAQSPPLPGDLMYIVATPERPLDVGAQFTMPWGAWNVTYHVDASRGPGKLTGRERYDCTVVSVTRAEGR